MKYIVAVAVFLMVGSLSAQTPEDCPLHAQHMQAMQHDKQAPVDNTSAGIINRGEKGMGFSQTATNHQIQEHHTRDPITKPAVTAQIKTLAPEQVQSLLGGEGMGMAKAAELNHYPGPRHVLDLASTLQLSKDQIAQSQAIYDEMHQKAVALGEQIIQQERALDHLFEVQEVSPDRVRALVAEIAELQGQLRSVHLLAHVAEKQVLSPEQVERYVELRTNSGPTGHSHAHTGL